MIDNYNETIWDQDLICPRCGNVIPDINTYCPHCIRNQERERIILKMIREDPKLNRLASISNLLLTTWKIFMILSFILIGFKICISITGLFAHLIPHITITLPVCIICAILFGILYLYTERMLNRLMERKLRCMEGRIYE